VAKNAVTRALRNGAVIKPIGHQMSRRIQSEIRPNNFQDLLDVLPAFGDWL
jgi:hypothetical protein